MRYAPASSVGAWSGPTNREGTPSAVSDRAQTWSTMPSAGTGTVATPVPVASGVTSVGGNRRPAASRTTSRTSGARSMRLGIVASVAVAVVSESSALWKT